MLPDHYRQPPIIPSDEPSVPERKLTAKQIAADKQLQASTDAVLEGKKASIESGMTRDSYIRFLMENPVEPVSEPLPPGPRSITIGGEQHQLPLGVTEDEYRSMLVGGFARPPSFRGAHSEGTPSADFGAMARDVTGQPAPISDIANREAYISFLRSRGEYAGRAMPYKEAEAIYDKNIMPYLLGKTGRIVDVKHRGPLEGKNWIGQFSPDETEKNVDTGAIRVNPPTQYLAKTGRSDPTSTIYHELGHAFDPVGALQGIRYGDIIIPEGADYRRQDYQDLFEAAGWRNLKTLKDTFPNLETQSSIIPRSSPHYQRYRDTPHENTTEAIAWILGGRMQLQNDRPHNILYQPHDIKSIRENGTISGPSGSAINWWEIQDILQKHPDVTDLEAAEAFNKIIGFKQAPTAQGQKA